MIYGIYGIYSLIYGVPGIVLEFGMFFVFEIFFENRHWHKMDLNCTLTKSFCLLFRLAENHLCVVPSLVKVLLPNFASSSKKLFNFYPLPEIRRKPMFFSVVILV